MKKYPFIVVKTGAADIQKRPETPFSPQFSYLLFLSTSTRPKISKFLLVMYVWSIQFLQKYCVGICLVTFRVQKKIASGMREVTCGPNFPEGLKFVFLKPIALANRKISQL